MIYIPPWLRLAQQEMNEGVVEIPGLEHNQRIIEYGKAVTLEVTTDEVPWCSNFVNWLFLQLSMERTRSAAARSWLQWGIRIENPALGCVAILSRGLGVQPDRSVIDAPGHVALLTDLPEPDMVTLLGANQSNKVCEKTYAMDRVLDTRWPG